MTIRRIAALGALAMLATAGCCHWRDRPHHSPGSWSSQPPYPATSGGVAQPGANPEILTPAAPGSDMPRLQPPVSSGFAAPAPTWSPPSDRPARVPPDLLPPTNVPIDYRYYGTAPPSPVINYQTAEPPLSPLNPFAQKPRVAEESRAAARPLPPDLLDPNMPERIPATPVPEMADAAATPTFPDGIPAFAEVKERIASGLKPDPDGLDWLKANRYRTVLHIRRPGTPHSADREQIEKRGLQYLSLEVAPESLTVKQVDEFNAVIADAGNLPLLVYDKDGTLAGAMWYLHFRTTEHVSPEIARIRAMRLGLKAADSGENAALWIAIQKLPLQ